MYAAYFKFFGILIYIFKEKNSPHKKPLVHVVFAEDKMSIASDGEILAGRLPRKQQKYVGRGLRFEKMKLTPLGFTQ